MADSVVARSGRRGSGRNPTTTASSSAITDRCDADCTSASAKSVVNEKVVPNASKPSQTVPAFLLYRSHANRSSVGSIGSFSSTGSSINNDTGFDSPVSSPLVDSVPTSPEEDSTPSSNEVTPSRISRRPRLHKTGDDTQETPGLESPTVAAARRRKSSTKSRASPNIPEVASRLSNSLVPPVTERLPFNSAPSTAPQTRPGSSLDNPIDISDDEILSTGLGGLTLEELCEGTTSAKKGRAASRALGGLTSSQRNRISSASGRVEGRAPSAVIRSKDISMPDDTLQDRMDWEPTSIPYPTLAVNPADACAVSVRTERALPPTLTGPSVVDVQQQAESRNVLAGSSAPQLAITPITRSPRPIEGPVPGQPIGGLNDLEHPDPECTKYRESFSIDNSESKIPGDDVGSESDTKSRHSNVMGDAPLLAAVIGFPDADDLRSESGTASELGNPLMEGIPPDVYPWMELMRLLATLLFVSVSRLYLYWQSIGPLMPRNQRVDSDDDDAEQEDDAELEDDAEPEARIVPDADRNPQYPNWRMFSEEDIDRKDVQAKLLDMIEKYDETPKSRGKKKYIYVYTSPDCEGHLKVGITKRLIRTRVLEQKECGLRILRIEDPNQRPFRYANLVDKLIKWELSCYRRAFHCQTCKNKKGRPTRHGEWYEIEQQRLLDVIEKWRAWVTKNNPYSFKGTLRPRWAWKLAKLDENREGVDLDHVLRPFTLGEKLSRRWDWIENAWNNYFDREGKLYRVAIELIVLIFAWGVLVHILGWQVGSGCFVGCTLGLLNYLSWR